MSLRDQIRAKTVGKPSVARIEKATIGEGEDAFDVEIRSPTVGARGVIYRKAGIGKSKGESDEQEVDLTKLQVYAVIECTFQPGTEVKVFEVGDEAALLNQPVGGWFDTLAEKAVKMLKPDEKVLRKNSEATECAKGSTS